MLVQETQSSLQAAFDSNSLIFQDTSGQNLLEGGIELQLWRGATDNDGIREWSGQEEKPLGQWLKAGLDRLKVTEAETEQDGNTLILRKKYRSNDALSEIVLVQRILSQNGAVTVNSRLTIPEDYPTLPRIGVRLPLKEGFENLKWYGRGPHENYIDRDISAFLGIYSQSVDEQFVPYILPQECGNHTDTRWVELSNGEMTLRVESDRRFEFSALHYTAEDLYGARHVTDLPERGTTWLSLDMIQRGLGTGSCGPQTRDEYEISPGIYDFSFRFTLV
ncbi:MAG: beta-galactosidase small subunit [Spirochaetales bacterium]|nr:beta-galactosidase small subunit [Spirochaetales bacterium]